jgi:hypothetical protein
MSGDYPLRDLCSQQIPHAGSPFLAVIALGNGERRQRNTWYGTIKVFDDKLSTTVFSL